MVTGHYKFVFSPPGLGIPISVPVGEEMLIVYVPQMSSTEYDFFMSQLNLFARAIVNDAAYPPKPASGTEQGQRGGE